ncbi:MAG: D-glucuronyl C5-epimerase family protein [bacterium]
MSFWHETPAINELSFGPELDQYFMTFKEKAEYKGPFDRQGVPLLDYRGKIGRQYNPIAIAQYGLGCLNVFLSLNDKEYLNKAIVVADWLVDNLEKNNHGLYCWHHKFDWEYFRVLKAPWYSGLAQGVGISFLLRMGKYSKKKSYMDSVEKAFKTLITPIEEGGCLHIDKDKNWWIEEYITSPPTHILNGFIWALWGVYDYYKETGYIDAKNLFDRSLKTLTQNLHRYDCGYWSLYDLSPLKIQNVASPFYHKLHLVQLDVMSRLTGDNLFKNYFKTWSEYQNNKTNRVKALLKKAIFKVKYF